MHKREDFHHTMDQVHTAITQADAIMEHFELTELERAHLRPVLVTLLSAKQIFYEQVGAMPGLALPPNARH